MSTYENAPATLLLATSCCCCGRPLVDAISVETGVGPECRKRYGFNEAQGPADWDAVAKFAEGLDFPCSGGDARKAVNVLVHRVAVGTAGDVVKTVGAIGALGYTKLAARLASRVAKVTITVEGEDLAIVTAYSEESVNALRSVPGRRWVKNEGGRGGKTTFPLSSRRALFNALTSLFPGAYGVGPKGMFQFAA